MINGWKGSGDLALIGVLLVCAGVQLARVIRYTPVFPKQIQSARQSRPKDQLNLLVANALMPNRTAQPLLGLIHDLKPDLVLALETDNWWQDRLDTVTGDYPYVVRRPLDNL